MSEAIRLRYVGEIGKLIKQIDAADGSTKTLVKDLSAATTGLRAYDRAQAALAGTASKAVVPALKETTEETKRTARAQAALAGTAKSAVVPVLANSTKQTERLAAASGGAARQTQIFAQQLPDVISQLSAGASPMTVFIQQGGQIVQQLDAMTVASIAWKAVSSPAALGVVALGTALVTVANHTADARAEIDTYTRGLKDTDEATWALVRSSNALRLATGDVDGFIGDLEIQTALLRGEISDADVEAGRLGGTLADTLRPRLMEAGKLWAENEALIQRTNEAIRSGVLDVQESANAHLKLSAAMDARTGLAANLAAVKEEQTRGAVAIDAYTNAIESSEAATQAAKDAERDRKDGLHDLRSAMEAVRKEEEFWAEVRAETDRIGAELATKRVDAAWAAAEDEVKRGDMLTAKAIADTRLIAEAEAAGARRAEATARASAQAISDVFAVGAEGAAFLAEQVAKEGIGTGKVLFGVSKALGIANATINTYQAATLALATIPPPFGAIAAGAAVASGLLSVGKITATEPQYHRGRATDEIPATILRSERVLTATGARVVGGDRAVAEANRGNAPQQTVTAAFVLGHQVYDRQTRTALRVPGSSLASALTRGRHVGHR